MVPSSALPGRAVPAANDGRELRAVGSAARAIRGETCPTEGPVRCLVLNRSTLFELLLMLEHEVQTSTAPFGTAPSRRPMPMQ
jgi:hypothetical protein